MTIRMQPELPWNVAGIAPEAREAARASARREGLSVGEWLTRRILESLGESNARDDGWLSAPSPQRRPIAEAAAPPPETADMLAHVSRSESETKSSGRRIEDQLRNLARRLDYTERSQSENSRAMTQAASEINIVSREQAQAFDQLGAHVVRLDERLARIEHLSAADATKDAIRALHLGLSRLADQMAETATRSAEQGAQLAENMGAIVGKLAESRDEGRQSWNALEERVAALAANVGSIAGRLVESRDLAERALKAIEARLGTAEQTLARLDAAEDAHSADASELHRRAGALSQLSESVESLTRRADALDSDTTQQCAHLEAVEKRFDAELATLAARVDAAGHRQSSALAELGSLVKDLSGRVDAVRAPAKEVPAEPDSTSRFGSPPFAEPATRSAEARPRPTPGAGLESFFASRTGGSGGQTAGARPFSWNDPRAAPKAQNRKTWIVLLAALAGLVIAAAAASAILSRAPAPEAQPPAHFVAPVPAKTPAPPAPTKPSQTVVAPPQTIPPQPAPRHARQTVRSAVKPARVADSPQARLAALANAGNATAETVLGIAYVDGKDRPLNEAEGAKWLERAALQGQAVAAWRLGTMYERGEGIPVDAAKSVEWYTVAAKAGNRKAMHNLAVAYANGNGVAKDLAKAAQWFARAAALGLADSQYNLAVLYERGLGVPQNLRAAYTWYAIAAARGDAGSQARLAALGSQLSADDKAAAEKAAADFRPDALKATANVPPELPDLSGGTNKRS